MKKTTLLLIILFTFFYEIGTAQKSFRKYSNSADSAYFKKNYTEAINYYMMAKANKDKYTSDISIDYNIACCYALNTNSNMAFAYLQLAVKKGYRNLNHIQQDADLVSLRGETRWKSLIDDINKNQITFNTDPLRVKLVSTDIDNFWEAHEAFTENPNKADEIFRTLYFDKASIGLLDYYVSKIGSVESFVTNQKKKPEFYKAIKENTLKIDIYKKEIKDHLVKLKDLYPAASFPNIYFVIGKFNSAGTASDNGLLIGVDQISKSADIPTTELNLWEKNVYSESKNIPIIVVHELIHFLQDNMMKDTSLLSNAVQEGMADYIAYLCTGENLSKRQHDFAKNQELKIWEEFTKEMDLNKSENWIANGDQESDTKPADLGYYIGFKICEAYYEEAKDKKAAIAEMLSITDYHDFLNKSKYDSKVRKLSAEIK